MIPQQLVMSKELISKFAQHLETSGKSNSTIIAYTKDLEQLHQHSGQDLHELTKTEIIDTIAKLQKLQELTPKTISRKINSFRTFYKYLQSQGHVKDNPAEGVDHPKVSVKPPRILNQMEYLALREVSRHNLRLYTMIELVLQSGLRIGELSRLKVKHIKLAKNGNGAGQLHIEEFSTIPERHIPLTPRAQQIVAAYIEDLNPPHEEHPLFPTRDGKHIIIRNIRSSIDRAMAKAGIEDACVNDLRNTFIVIQLKAGVPIDVISEAVGHRSRTTTQKYFELMDEDYKPSGESKLVDV